MKAQYTFVNDDIKQRLIAYRRDFHRYPELGWMEVLTSEKIAARLQELGYTVYCGEEVCDRDSCMGVPKESSLLTGVVGVLRGKTSTKVTALRFDMDALPIQEMQTDINTSYCSQNAGVMHACGHDGHMAVGLGLAEILSQNREYIEGEIRLIFQPAEEGCRGAKSIVKKGWLDGIDEFYSGHIGIGCRELGRIGACTRGFMASTKMDIIFHGVAAHAANAPEKGRNALLAAADFIVAAYDYYQQCSENVRMNVGRIHAGSGRNIIADKAFLEVETRGIDGDANIRLKEKLCRLAESISEKHGVTYEVVVVGDVGTGKSDPELVKCGYDAANRLGLGDMFESNAVFNASEDVVTMMNHVQNQGGKAAYFMCGTELIAEHHHSRFDFNEEVLPLMVEFYSKLLVKKPNKPYHSFGL